MQFLLSVQTGGLEEVQSHRTWLPEEGHNSKESKPPSSPRAQCTLNEEEFCELPYIKGPGVY